MRLGRQELKSLGPVERATIVYDDELKGFGLRIMPPSGRAGLGTRTWIVEYRPGSGGRKVTKRRLKIGRADTLTPEEARKAAKDILAAARVGPDPALERAEARKAHTVGELGDRYLDETNAFRKPRTGELYRGLWRRYISAEIGHLRVRELARSDIERVHRKIGAQHRSTANRVVILISHFYAWAQAAGETPAGVNPARGIRKFKEQGRERYLTEAEFARLGSALREAESVGIEWRPDLSKPKAKHAPVSVEARRVKVGEDVGAAVRLLMLTGARLREILHLEWSHVDLERGMLFLPDSKTGRKTIFLGSSAVEVLAGLAKREHLAPSRYVIRSEDPEKPRADLKRPWRLITRHAGLTGVRIHDLRHSYASIGAGAGLGLPVLGKLLGHSDVATTERYAHLGDDPIRRASDFIAGSIATAMGHVEKAA